MRVNRKLFRRRAASWMAHPLRWEACVTPARLQAAAPPARCRCRCHRRLQAAPRAGAPPGWPPAQRPSASRAPGLPRRRRPARHGAPPDPANWQHRPPLFGGKGGRKWAGEGGWQVGAAGCLCCWAGVLAVGGRAGVCRCVGCRRARRASGGGVAMPRRPALTSTLARGRGGTLPRNHQHPKPNHHAHKHACTHAPTLTTACTSCLVLFQARSEACVRLI